MDEVYTGSQGGYWGYCTVWTLHVFYFRLESTSGDGARLPHAMLHAHRSCVMQRVAHGVLCCDPQSSHLTRTCSR